MSLKRLAVPFNTFSVYLTMYNNIHGVSSLSMYEPVPDLGLWRPLGNNIIEKTSTPLANKFNDCKDMCGLIMLQLTMSRNVAATQTVTTCCP